MVKALLRGFSNPGLVLPHFLTYLDMMITLEHLDIVTAHRNRDLINLPLLEGNPRPALCRSPRLREVGLGIIGIEGGCYDNADNDGIGAVRECAGAWSL